MKYEFKKRATFLSNSIDAKLRCFDFYPRRSAPNSFRSLSEVVGPSPNDDVTRFMKTPLFQKQS